MSCPADDKYHDLFCARRRTERLGEKAVRGGASAFGAEIGSSLLRIVSTAVLARLLLPEDFGLLAMVTAFTVVVERFKDLGLADATIQLREISHRQVSTLFWVNLLISMGIALLIVSLSNAIAWFYNESRLTAVSIVLASTFLFSGCVIQHRAILGRQLHFGTLGIIQLCSVGLGVLIAIVLAYYGFGYWALVAREVSRAIFDAVGIWFACPWRPGRPRRGVGLAPFLSFGGSVTGFNLIYFLSRSLDKILLGKMFGPYWVGLYTNAFQLIALPVSQIQSPMNSVALPALSTVQAEPAHFKAYYEKMLQVLTFFTMPVVVFVAIFGDLIIGILLGPKWLEAVWILQILAVGAYIEPVVHAVGPAMVAMGKTKEYLRLGIINAVLLIICMVLGSFYGVMGVATGYTLATYFALATSLAYGLRKTHVVIRHFLKKLTMNCCLSLLTALVLLCTRYAAGWLVTPLWLVFFSAVGVLTYLGLWLVIPSGRMMLYEYWLLAKRAISSARG